MRPLRSLLPFDPKTLRPGDKRFLILVPLTGAATGFAAVGLVRLLGLVQKFFWGTRHHLLDAAQSLPAAHRLLAPIIGGLILGLMIVVLRREFRGHGTTGIIVGVAQQGGFIPMGATLLKETATLVTVGSGGSLGREGPLLRVGAAIGSLLGRRLGLTGHRLKILVGCGAAAGIAAAYNAPIGGAMFALEVILGNFALESFGPIVVASVIGTVISRSLISAYPAYTPPVQVSLVSAWELGHHLVMGLLIGIASVLFILALRWVEKAFDALPVAAWAKPLIGFTLLGAIGVYFPQVFGNGYDTVDLVLHGAIPLGLILALPLLKLAATALTLGSGGSGGLFTPTLFVGSMLGAAYGSWCHGAAPAATAAPGVYALVGMGAMIAGTTQAPLTAIMTIFELTGDYQILLPLMFACTVAVVVSRLLHKESIYTAGLADRGVRLGGRIEELVMDTLEVRDVMRRGALPVRDNEPLEAVLKRMLQEGRKELFVVGADGRFRGAITLADMTVHMRSPEALAKVTAGEVAYGDVPVLGLGDHLSEAIGRWTQVSRDRLPVVDGPVSRRYVGELSAGDIISIYSQEVLHKETRLARFERPVGAERQEATYVQLPQEYVVALVTLSERLRGATLRTLDARRRFGVNVLEVKRRIGGGLERRLIPDPDMLLQPGDSLIVVGRPSEIALLGDAGPESPPAASTGPGTPSTPTTPAGSGS